MSENGQKSPGISISKKRKHWTRRKKKALIVIIICTLITLTVSFICLGYAFYHHKIALMQFSDGVATGDAFSAEESAGDAEAMAAEMAGLQAFDAVLAEGDILSSPSVFNILLIGTDERTRDFNDNARGDSCMLLSINKRTAQAHLISFERAMGVPILDGQYQGQWDWLTHTFRYGGADLMMREIEENFKIQVDYYARANIYTFMQMIDAVGGVDIELTQAEADYINHPQGTYAEGHIREMGIADQVQTVTAGPNHLNGATAMLYARCRYIDSDWHRVERQRNVMDSLMQSARGLDLLGLNAMLDKVLPHIQTNLPESEITALLLAVAPKFKDITLAQETIPAPGTYGSMTGMGGRSLFAVDFSAKAKLLQQELYGSQAQ